MENLPPDLTSVKTQLNIFESRIRKNDVSSIIDDGSFKFATLLGLIANFTHFRFSVDCNTLCVVLIF